MLARFSNRTPEASILDLQVGGLIVEGACAYDADHPASALARYDGGGWAVRSTSFFLLEIHGPLEVQVEGKAVEGPFERFTLADGMAYIDGRRYAEFANGVWVVPHLARPAWKFVVAPLAPLTSGIGASLQ